jgi:hypothetical protein
MSSSSKTRKSSLKKTKTLSPMEKHQLSDIVIDFDEDLITCTRTLKSHRWSNKQNFLKDISSKYPDEILNASLSNFGLCNISSINKFMDEDKSLSYNQKAAVNELFKIKYAMKQYPGDINEQTMRDISKTKLDQLTKMAEKDKKWEKKWGDRFSLAELGISTETSSVAATTVATDELSLEERLARLKTGRGKETRSKKRKGTKRRGTKQRQQGIKRRRTKSRR